MLVDSHCHLHDREFFTEVQAEEMLKRAREKGVAKIICIGTSSQDSLAAKEFAEAHENVFWTYGIHPSEADKDPKIRSDLQEMLSESGPARKLVGIGEVGLDYHYGAENRKKQLKLFEKMLDLGVKNELPFSFHIREAFDDFFAVIRNFPEVSGVVHSFSDNKKNLKRILTETNFYVGVNGMATYSTLPTPPLNRILLETDAPFLTPKPFRGIINESGYIREIALWLSEKLGVDFSETMKETTENVKQLFHI